MPNYPTNFVESNVLLAMAEGDTETAEEILADMGTFGIKDLRKAAQKTVQLCDRILYERERGERPPWARA